MDKSYREQLLENYNKEIIQSEMKIMTLEVNVRKFKELRLDLLNKLNEEQLQEPQGPSIPFIVFRDNI